LKLGIRSVVMKLGKRGCLIVDDRTVRQVPCFSIDAVDSTGAGDAFTAAFLQARLRSWPMAEAALAANAAGAAAASVVGAGERLPSRQQIVRVLSAARLKNQWDEIRLCVLRRLSEERHECQTAATRIRRSDPRSLQPEPGRQRESKFFPRSRAGLT